MKNKRITDAWLRSGAGPHKTKRELTEKEDIEEQMEYDHYDQWIDEALERERWAQAAAEAYWRLEKECGCECDKTGECKCGKIFPCKCKPR